MGTVMHFSRYALMARGFKLVASYECFTKGERKLNIDCYTDGKCYLVRNYYSRGRAWDDVYTDKDQANARVKILLGLRKWHRRII